MRKTELITKEVCFALGLLLIPWPCLAQGSGYYENSESGRPTSAFSLCCCKKENENIKQVYYSCKYEEKECSENTKEYKVNGFECPSNLLLTRYQD